MLDASLSCLMQIGKDIEVGSTRSFDHHFKRYSDVLEKTIQVLPANRQQSARQEVNRSMLGLLAWYHATLQQELPRHVTNQINVAVTLLHLSS